MFVDLYVANYVQLDLRQTPARGTPGNCRFMNIDMFCGPRPLTGEADTLYRNTGHGTFVDVTHTAGMMDPRYYGFGVLFSDLNGDGWPDIYVANDSVPNLYFRNRGNGTFVEEGLVAGIALSADGREQAGMGVDAGDYDGDGLPDIIETNFSQDHTTLYRNGRRRDVRRRQLPRRDGGDRRTLSRVGRRPGRPRQRRPARRVHRQRPRLSRRGAHGASNYKQRNQVFRNVGAAGSATSPPRSAAGC